METDPQDAATFRMMVKLEDRGLLLSSFETPLIETLAWDAATGKLVAANGLARTAYGLTMREISKAVIGDVVPGIDRARLARFQQRMQAHGDKPLIFRIRHQDHNGHWRLIRVLLRYLAEPRQTFVAQVQNISRYLEARTAAAMAKDVLSTAIEALPGGFVLYDAQDGWLSAMSGTRKFMANQPLQ